MATVIEQLKVIGYLYPDVDREIVDGVLVVDPTVDLTLIDFDTEYQNYLLSIRRAALIEKVSELRKEKLEVGMSYTFNGVVDGVQTREMDLTILLTLSIKANKAIEAGIVSPVFPFRSTEDNNYLLTPQEMLDLVTAVDNFVSTAYEDSWALKSIINSSTLLELDTLVITL